MLDTVILSRAQFGFTIGFHILFPTFNIGLALFLTIMEGVWLKTQKPIYLEICKFWSTIFALTFGMGVVSGIVLSYELGTNFNHFTAAVGSVLGPLFSYEVLSAFFLEAGFLGIMLFGWNRVNPKLHFCATLLVTFGTAISAFWIMSANSWMQTPAGYEIVDQKFVVDNWFQVIFNPSFLPRFSHMLMASYVTTSFIIGGVAANYLLKNRHVEFARVCLIFAILAGLTTTTLQIILGDVVGIRVREQQPLKTAAIEAVWDTTHGAPFVIFAWPNTQTETNDYAITIPYAASLINTHHLNGELLGLKSVQATQRPVVVGVFFAFRIMLAIGFFLLFTAIYGTWLLWRQKLFTHRLFLRVCVFIAPLGFISTIAGWLTTEWGRQPWIVYNLMTTAQAASALSLHQVMISFLLFIIVYGIIFVFYLLYLLRLIHKGPTVLKNSEELQHPPFSYLEANQ